MNPALSIVRATQCWDTHHFFALDALGLVQTEAGRRLVSHLTRHHHRYLAGATDPDTRFRDFQNHVVHVTDGYWGGAPRVAHQWYDRLQRYLRSDRFSDAAHAAGVLSHYFTDPMQPLHTQQCDRERILHRPIEWSINRSYRRIFQTWKQDDMRVVFQMSGGPGWLGEAILHGARFANRKYRSLLDSYQLDRALVEPAAGLDDELTSSLAELVGLSITGLARVLERAAADAEGARREPIPMVDPLLPLLLATIRVPVRLVQRQRMRRRYRTQVTGLIDEFQRTGQLSRFLPTEVDIVHRVVKIRADEQRWKQQRMARLASTQTKIEISHDGDDLVILPFTDRKTGRSNDGHSYRRRSA